MQQPPARLGRAAGQEISIYSTELAATPGGRERGARSRRVCAQQMKYFYLHPSLLLLQLHGAGTNIFF